VPTGIAGLDRLTGGLRSGQLVLLGARPSVGKSALGFGIGLHVAEQAGPVLVVSAEMGAVELATRGLAGGGVASDRLLSGRLDDVDFARLRARRDHLARLPVFVDDAPGVTVGAIRARARRQAAAGGLALVVVDYLQLVGSEGRRERRELEVAEVSRGLKALARELAVPVLALCQLNRGVEARSDKRPVLSDLRDSGQQEQDADLVLLLHRPALYDTDADPGQAELLVAKHRSGPTGTVPLTWLGWRMTFVDAGSVFVEGGAVATDEGV
jgi:replicative DNA helicase